MLPLVSRVTIALTGKQAFLENVTAGRGVPRARLEQVAEHCAERLARFKCPTTIRMVDALPHSATGKVAKGRLRDVYGDDGYGA